MSTTSPELATHRAATAALRELPLPAVWLDGEELTGEALRTLGPLRIRQEASAPAVCELELDFTGSMPRPARGMAVRVRLEGAGADVFSGEVVALGHRLGPDGIHRVRLRCFDRGHRLRQTSAVTAHTDVSVAGLAEALAGRHGLEVTAAEPGPTWPRVIQQGESDLELLSRLVDEAGLWWQVQREVLRLQRWEAGEEHEVTWGIDLLEASVDSDATAAATTVRALGWDPVERDVWDAVVNSSGAGSPAADGDLVGGEGLLTLAGRVYASTRHAEAQAQSDLDARTGAAGIIRAVVRGDLRWRPGVHLRLADQPADIAGPYLVRTVEHLVDSSTGYVCVLSSRPAPRPTRPVAGGTAFTLAEVIEVDDPDRAGRVRVGLPAFDDVESEWLPVLSLGAGEGKGLLCQPDTGDTVLVLYAADDPGRGVVLGGLFADHLPGDAAGVTGRAVRRFGWNTADGQRLLLNRDGDAVTIGNGAGSMIEITKDAVRLHAEADLTIEAPGKKLTIRANTVDFERA